MYCLWSTVRRAPVCVPYREIRGTITRCRGLVSSGNAHLVDNGINPHIVRASYAVRGPILEQADSLESKLRGSGDHGYPFEKIVKLNIGNPQALLQPSITFTRQLLAACAFPDLWNGKAKYVDVLPTDVIERAKQILKSCDGESMGSYSHAKGVTVIREHVAEYIERRDGCSANLDDIYMLSGASEGVRMILKLMAFGKKTTRTGVMIPIPQYPLYSASLTEFNLKPIPYYLDEAAGWSLNIDSLHSAVEEARKSCTPRILVVINPGNPTGQCLSEKNVEEIVNFCLKEDLLLMADEVYQENVYSSDLQFHSFKKKLRTMNLLDSGFRLASFHSASKGLAGECGQRGGYMEIIGFSKDFMQELLKIASIRLCPTLAGQIVMDSIVKPPSSGDESYEQFVQERHKIFSSLKEKADLVSKDLNDIDGIQCNPVNGAMYAFPKINIPDGAIRAAKERDKPLEPDEFYCLKMLEDKGICVVPGSGFEQEPGSYHFRMAILPPIEDIRRITKEIAEFHKSFTETYSN